MTVVDKQSKSENSLQSPTNQTGGAAQVIDNENRVPPFPVLVLATLVGVYFGIVLVKSEVVRWQRVHDMFLFREAHMYLIISVGIIVAAISIQIMKRLGLKTLQGKPVHYKPKPWHGGIVIGGTLFGAGWAITGACPGPIYAQIGGGETMALVTMAGALLGMFAYAVLKPSLPH